MAVTWRPAAWSREAATLARVARLAMHPERVPAAGRAGGRAGDAAGCASRPRCGPPTIRARRRTSSTVTGCRHRGQPRRSRRPGSRPAPRPVAPGAAAGDPGDPDPGQVTLGDWRAELDHRRSGSAAVPGGSSQPRLATRLSPCSKLSAPGRWPAVNARRCRRSATQSPAWIRRLSWPAGARSGRSQVGGLRAGDVGRAHPGVEAGELVQAGQQAGHETVQVLGQRRVALPPRRRWCCLHPAPRWPPAAQKLPKPCVGCTSAGPGSAASRRAEACWAAARPAACSVLEQVGTAGRPMQQ